MAINKRWSTEHSSRQIHVIFGKLQFYVSVRYFIKLTLRTDSLVAVLRLAPSIMDYKD